MTDRFTVDDLIRFMRESAGEDEHVDLGGDVLDRTFEELGYDSLAFMETTSRIERDLKVALPEEELADVATLRDYVDFVNGRLSAKA